MKRRRTPKPVIRMYAHDPCCLTAKEFEKLCYEVFDRLMAVSTGLDTKQISDRILLRMIYDVGPRYCEVANQVSGKIDPTVEALYLKLHKLRTSARCKT